MLPSASEGSRIQAGTQNVVGIPFGNDASFSGAAHLVPAFHGHSGPHIPMSSLECMAGTTGLEPATSAVTGQRSNQLSYVPR